MHGEFEGKTKGLKAHEPREGKGGEGCAYARQAEVHTDEQCDEDKHDERRRREIETAQHPGKTDSPGAPEPEKCEGAHPQGRRTAPHLGPRAAMDQAHQERHHDGQDDEGVVDEVGGDGDGRALHRGFSRG